MKYKTKTAVSFSVLNIVALLCICEVFSGTANFNNMFTFSGFCAISTAVWLIFATFAGNGNIVSFFNMGIITLDIAGTIFFKNGFYGFFNAFCVARAIPTATALIFCFLYAEKGKMKIFYPLLSPIFPCIYFAVASQILPENPYYLIDMSQLNGDETIYFVILLLTVYAVIGTVTVLVDRVLYFWRCKYYV